MSAVLTIPDQVSGKKGRESLHSKKCGRGNARGNMFIFLCVLNFIIVVEIEEEFKRRNIRLIRPRQWMIGGPRSFKASTSSPSVRRLHVWL